MIEPEFPRNSLIKNPPDFAYLFQSLQKPGLLLSVLKEYEHVSHKNLIKQDYKAYVASYISYKQV